MPRELSLAQQGELLGFLLATYRAASELPEALSRLGYDPVGDGIWADRAGHRENYDSLLRRARSGGWLCLLALCAVAERIGGPGARSLAESLFSPHLQAGLSLYGNVLVDRERELTRATISACFRKAKQGLSGAWEPTLPTGGDPESLLSVAYWLACAEEAKVGRPLYLFAREIRPNLSEVGRERLDVWWGETASRLGLAGQLSGDPAATGPKLDACYAVLVELRETAGSSPRSPEWMRRAWLQPRGGGPPDPLDREDPIGKTETPETMPDYLSGLLDELALRGIPQDRLAFEFFVSHAYLACSIDQWKVPVAPDTRSEIGFEIPVVLRARDRKPWSKKYVSRRWSTLEQSPCLCGETVRPAGRGGNTDEIYKDYLRDDKLLCLRLGEPVTEPETLEEFKCLAAANAAGVPVILWARRDGAAATLPTWADNSFLRPPRELPGLVHQLRQGCKSDDCEHLGWHLTLWYVAK
jgi:hypothetical protein